MYMIQLSLNDHRLEENMVIRIADFGFSEKLYTKIYLRMVIDGTVRLPVKWMAPESIGHGLFSEKSDVVREFFNFQYTVSGHQSCHSLSLTSGHLE